MNYPVNLIGPAEHTSEKRILLPFIVADPKTFIVNLKIYRYIGLNGKRMRIFHKLDKK